MIESVILNNKLMAQQGISQEDVDALEALHVEMAELKATKLEDINNIEDYNLELKGLEYEMQWRWGFPQDADFHMHWFTDPKCECPPMDNSDMLGTKYRIYSGECPLHGGVLT